MKRFVSLLFVVACVACGDDRGQASATVVQATVTGCDGCYAERLTPGMCGDDMELLDPDHQQDVRATTPLKNDQIAALVQVQYPSYQPYGQPAHVDFVLADGDYADVLAAFGEPSTLYLMSAAGEISDVNGTPLVLGPGNTLHFEYTVGDAMVSEEHVVDAPRTVKVEAVGTCLCDAGRPQELGVVVAALLLGARRRRKLRA